MRKSIPIAAPKTPAPDAVSLPSLSSLPSLPPIPDGWEAKAAMVDQCIGAGKRLTLWIAMLVAKGRCDFANPSDWIADCVTRWGWSKSFLYQIHDAGILLLAPYGRVCHDTLMLLQVDKLYYLTKLPENLLVPFLEKARPQDHSRDEVRAAVNRWLKAAGEPTDDAPAPTHPSRTQYDFLDLLFAPPAKVDDPQVFHDQVHARAGSVSAGAAQLIAFRSVVCLDAMVPRMAAGGARDLATALRELADEADKQAAKGV